MGSMARERNPGNNGTTQQEHPQQDATGGGQPGANLIGWPLPIFRLGQSQSEGLHIKT